MIHPVRLARFAPAALLLLAAALCAPAPARAQSIVAVVNGTPITSMDVSERRAFIQLAQHKSEGTRQVTDELIDEALILNQAKRYGIAVPESAVDARFADVARSAKLAPEQLAKVLAMRGASARTFKQSIRAQLAYRTLLSRSFDPSSAVAERDVQKELTSSGSEAKAYRYTVRQIIFVVGKNPSPAALARRRSEAIALRNRFTDCQSGAALVRGLHDVAIREPVIRDSSQFPKDVAQEIERTPDGHLTMPQAIDVGVQMIAVCSRRAVAGGEARRTEVMTQLADEKFKQEAKDYIQELRRQAVIQYR